jgi:hypothetical protein
VGDFVSDWTGAGLTEVALPSGVQVRLRLPEPRDLIVRGLLPSELIQAVLEKPDVDWSAVAEDNAELTTQMASAMNTLAADSIRQGRRTATDEWEAVTVPVETYLRLPDDDRELIEAKILANLPGEPAGATPEAARAAREEAAGTVDGYREFRDESGRADRRKGRGAVRPAAVDADRTAAPDGGAGARPRARRAPRGS